MESLLDYVLSFEPSGAQRISASSLVGLRERPTEGTRSFPNPLDPHGVITEVPGRANEFAQPTRQCSLQYVMAKYVTTYFERAPAPKDTRPPAIALVAQNSELFLSELVVLELIERGYSFSILQEAQLEQAFLTGFT
jgi:hypothetical protein